MVCHPLEAIVFVARYGNISAFDYSSIVRGLTSRGLDSPSVEDEGGGGGADTRGRVQWVCDVLQQSSARELRLLAVNSEGTLLGAVVHLNSSDVLQVYDVSSMTQAQTPPLVGSYPLKTGCTPLRILFHAFEPVLLVLVEESLPNGKQLILQYHSLLFFELTKFTIIQLNDSVYSNSTVLHCSSYTGATLFASNTKTCSGMSVNIYPLKFRFLEHVTNSLPLPLEYFIDGERCLKQPLGTHPILIINPAISSSSKAPVQMSHHVFVSKLATYAKDKSAVKYLGSLELSKGEPEGFVFLPLSLKLKSEQKNFVPESLCHTLPCGSSLLDASWWAIVNGYRLSNAPEDFRIPSACLIRFTDGVLSSTLIDCAWAVPWKTHGGSNMQQGFLCIDSTYRCLHFISTEKETCGHSLGHWNFDLRLEKISIPQDRYPDLVLLVGKSENGDGKTALYLSSAASLTIDVDQNRFSLAENENLKQVAWLPAISRSYMSEMTNVFAVCTSHRILIFSQSLNVLSSISYHDATSCCWVGLSLVVMTIDGRIMYQVPGELNSSKEFSYRWMSLAENGIIVPLSVDRDLFSLPKESGAIVPRKILSCFPDRIIFSGQLVQISQNCVMRLLTRPLIPTEPIISGLLWLYMSSSSDKMKKFISGDIRSALILYSKFKSCGGPDTVGASPNMQMSIAVCGLLYCCGLFELSAIGSGVEWTAPIQSAMVGDGEFPRCRWLPSYLKYEILKELKCFDRACIEVLLDHREAVDMFTDPDRVGVIVRKNSLIAQISSSVARDLYDLGQFELAGRMADIAGDDILLAMILKSQGNESVLGKLCNELEAVDQNTWNVIRAQVLNLSLNDLTTLALPNIGGICRRQRLLSNYEFIHSTNFSNESNGNEREIFKGNAFGPVTGMGFLPMDSVEEWMGTQSLEFLADGLSQPSQRSDHSEMFNNRTTKPATWIDDIGKGKEWDMVMGVLKYKNCVVILS